MATRQDVGGHRDVHLLGRRRLRAELEGTRVAASLPEGAPHVVNPRPHPCCEKVIEGPPDHRAARQPEQAARGQVGLEAPAIVVHDHDRELCRDPAHRRCATWTHDSA